MRPGNNQNMYKLKVSQCYMVSLISKGLINSEEKTNKQKKLFNDIHEGSIDSNYSQRVSSRSKG